MIITSSLNMGNMCIVVNVRPFPVFGSLQIPVVVFVDLIVVLHLFGVSVLNCHFIFLRDPPSCIQRIIRWQKNK